MTTKEFSICFYNSLLFGILVLEGERPEATDASFELKKHRFQFLEKLYEESKGDTDIRFNPGDIFKKIGLAGKFPEFFKKLTSAYTYSAELMGMVKYLESEGLITMDYGRELPTARPFAAKLGLRDGVDSAVFPAWMRWEHYEDPLTITHEGIKEVERLRERPSLRRII
jgi:hypothetical protein